MGEKGYALITGGGRGIGAAMCREMASQGYDVAIADIVINDAIVQLARELEDGWKIRAVPVKVDVSNYAMCMDMMNNVVAALGRDLAVLVNNASIGSGGMFLDAKPEEFTRVLSIDLCSALNVTHVALPYMITRKSGCIVNMSSASALIGIDAGAIYCAAKAGIIGMTKAMAKEFARYGIRVNAIAPGVTRTPMLPNQDPELLRSASILGIIGEPEDQAQCLGYIVNARTLTGQILSPNGGMAI